MRGPARAMAPPLDTLALLLALPLAPPLAPPLTPLGLPPLNN